MEKLNEVKSSNIKAIMWDENELYVKYNSGSYVYHQVPRELFLGLSDAESKGTYMNQFIKGHYKYDRLPEDKAW